MRRGKTERESGYRKRSFTAPANSTGQRKTSTSAVADTRSSPPPSRVTSTSPACSDTATTSAPSLASRSPSTTARASTVTLIEKARRARTRMAWGNSGRGRWLIRHARCRNPRGSSGHRGHGSSRALFLLGLGGLFSVGSVPPGRHPLSATASGAEPLSVAIRVGTEQPPQRPRRLLAARATPSTGSATKTVRCPRPSADAPLRPYGLERSGVQRGRRLRC